MRKCLIGVFLLFFYQFVSSQTLTSGITLAHLHDNITISNNTSTNFNVAVTGGTSPFSIFYTKNGTAQAAVNNYLRRANLSTRTLATGAYKYPITSLTDAAEYSAQSLGTSTTVTVTDGNSNLKPGRIGSPQSICYNTKPNTLDELTAPTGGTRRYTYQWQKSADNTSWTNITGATGKNYSPAALTASTYFRRAVLTASTYIRRSVSSGTYTSVYSSSILITVSPRTTLAQLHDNISVLNNTSANINVAVSGGTSPFSFNYIRNGVVQTTVSNYSSGDNVSTGVLTKGVYTYVLTSLTDAGGCEAQSLGTGITVTVTDGNGNLTAGTIGIPQTICYNIVSNALTQLTAPTGGSGTYTYQWQSSTNNTSWADITGATSQGYSPSPLTASTYFRRTVSSGTYSPVYSASVLITVSPQIALAQLHDNISILNNTSTNFNVTVTGGISPFSFNYTRNGTAQPAINNYSSGANVSTGTLASGVYTYVLTSLTDAGGCVAQSLGTSIAVTVTDGNGNLTAGTIGTPQSICYNAVPDALTQLTAPTGGSGMYTYQWQSSANNAVWNNISGAMQSGYSPSALTANTYFRRIVSSDTYTPVYSSSILIAVLPQIALAQLHDNISILNNTSTNFNVTVIGGISPFSFNYTRNGTAQAAVNNYSSGANVSTGTLANGVYTYVLTSLTDAGGCVAQSLGTGITVNVTDGNGNLTAGTIGAPQSICYNTVPDALTQLTAPTGGSGTYTYQWQSSANNTSWTNITGATNKGYSPSALAANTYFRRTVSSGTYSPVYSASVLITVSPQIALAQLHDNISILNNTSTNFNVTVTGGISPFSFNYTRNGTAQAAVNNYSSGANVSTGTLANGVYTYVLTSLTDAGGCVAQSLGTGITVTVTDGNGNLTAGTIGAPQSICYNTVPDALTQLTAPTGGSGTYTYRWQNSVNNTTWTNITGATNQGYSPSVLTASTYFRRTVSSGTYTSVNSASILITVSPQITLVQLHDNISILNNTSTNFNVTVTGGISPFSFNYTRNGTAQAAVNNYSSGANVSTGTLANGVYTYVLTSLTDAGGCVAQSLGTGITVTVTDGNGNLTAGTIGAPQSICYNTVPDALTQLTAPTGGSGTYTYQWQSSANNTSWTNITGATNKGYSPSALTASTYFRRTVSSGTYTPVNGASILITVSPQITLAQLYDNITIANNTSTNLNVAITGGTSPFIINYTCNGSAQTAVNNYNSGASISTGALTTGTYTYTLTSVTDATGCASQNLGTSIVVTVTDQQAADNSNKALVIVNSGSANYQDYITYIKPYLDNFGIPYDECNINSTSLPQFTDYAVLIFGHKNVYSSGYPITQIDSAVSNGVGLYSFDPHLFDYTSGFNTLISHRSVNSNQINISNTTQYITQNHIPDTFNPTNNVVQLLSNWNVTQTSKLVNGTELANMTSGSQSVSLLQISNYGAGRIVKWCGYDWVFDNILGAVYGMDDLIWRGIVWAARKPFAMQGLPPMFTFRVDDVTGAGFGSVNFAWVEICNEYGIIPWLGTFNDYIYDDQLPVLKNYLDNNLATAAPHAFWWNDFIYFNHDNVTQFDVAARTKKSLDFYTQNGFKLSKYLVPHYYEISAEALPQLRAAGIEFLGIHMLPDHPYYTSAWINCGPYRINRNGLDDESRPVYYGANVNISGIDFFNCITEIRDDGGYEWYPDNNVDSTAARGIRQLKRAFDSMVLSNLFTHEYYFETMSDSNFREIIRLITSNLSMYNPEYTTIDYAVQYIRAKNNIKITGTVETSSSVEISYSGSNDLDTRCYLFTEQNGVISYSFVQLPRINGSNKVIVSK